MRKISHTMALALLMALTIAGLTTASVTLCKAAAVAAPTPTASCGGYGPACTPSPRPSRTPPGGQPSPSPSVPTTTRPPHVTPSPSPTPQLPLTGDSGRALTATGVGLGLLISGALIAYLMRRRRPRC